ncbi:MAG TPA: hypothetical protein VEQ15_00225 [Myxococcales bacterium]|nr:hypothetical protein [Myxococcales bacterium]
MADRIEVAARLVMVGAYVAVCAGFLLVLFPGVRVRLVRAGRAQLYAYRVGVYRATRSSVSREWQAIMRSDLPDEPAA